MTDVPYNAKVTLTDYDTGDGFQTPIIPEHLSQIYKKNGVAIFGKEPVYHGCGGSIPFMGDLGKTFPKA